jgi:hypothetical protein
VDSELGIEACAKAPSNWGHPPSVNSLEPSSVQAPIPFKRLILNETNIKKSYKRKHDAESINMSKRSCLKRTGLSSANFSAKSSSFVIISALPKRKVALLSVNNGEEFAALKVFLSKLSRSQRN